MSPQLACLLCGADTGEITVRLVEWREPIGGRLYESIPRCVRIDDCWARVTAVVEEDWPVADGRPVRAPAPTPEPATVAAEVLPDPDWLTQPTQHQEEAAP